MSNVLYIANNPLEPKTWIKYENIDDVLKELTQHYETFPSNARIYHNFISALTDVTPTNDDEIKTLASLKGTFYVILYPEAVAAAVIAIVVAVIAIAAAFFLKPSIPIVEQKASSNRGSSNNELSERTNDARPGERIPYIVGKLRAYPDLVTSPYITLSGGQEIEHCCFCLGEGEHAIYSAFEDETKFTEISGNSLMAYNPNEDVVNGTPFYTLGQPFKENLYVAKAASSVTGQTLLPTNTGRIAGNNNIYFQYPDTIIITDETDFTDAFLEGENLSIINSVIASSYSLDGSYVILSVSKSQITLSNPQSLNSNWAILETLPNGESETGSPVLQTTDVKWVGPFDLFMTERNRVLINIRAPQGLYRIGTDSNQYIEHVDFQVEFSQLNDDGTLAGLVEYHNGRLLGSATLKDSVGITVDHKTSWTGPCRVRIRRTTPTNTIRKDRYVDGIKVTQVYAVEELPYYVFGPETIIRTRSYSTASALTVKDRKLNLLVERKLPVINKDYTISNTLQPTSSAADILLAICREPTIGNRQLSEIDVVQFYDTMEEIKDYFGIVEATQFCYTFDDANISFEESINTIAQTVFCQAYRRGNIIKLFFEKKVKDSVILFNHRNKLPNSETRTVTFGYFNEHDGVNVEWRNPDDFDAKETFSVPKDGSAINPKKLDFLGIRNRKQAHLLAYRAFNKIKHQNITVNFTSTDEGNVLLLNERILVSDNTRPPTLEGEILSVEGLEVLCSQKVELNSNLTYNMFLQLSDSTVQSIKVTQGRTSNHVILNSAPRLPLVTGNDKYAKTTYQIVSSVDVQQRAFLVTEISPSDNYTVDITAKNYDDVFYKNDGDFDMRINVAIGGIMMWPLNTPPNGWLECNGQAFNTELYPILAKIYPSGTVPDWRGLFMRGWDHGAGHDPGRVIGSKVTSSSHTHITGRMHGDSGAAGDDVSLIVGSQSWPFAGTTARVIYGDKNTATSVPFPSGQAGQFVSTSEPIGDVAPPNVAAMFIVATDAAIEDI